MTTILKDMMVSVLFLAPLVLGVSGAARSQSVSGSAAVSSQIALPSSTPQLAPNSAASSSANTSISGAPQLAPNLANGSQPSAIPSGQPQLAPNSSQPPGATQGGQQ